MHSKHLTLPTDKLILVSRSGFYEPALTKARFYGIETITLEEALETDWDLAIRMLTDGFFELFTYWTVRSSRKINEFARVPAPKVVQGAQSLKRSHNKAYRGSA
jgi:hypothetical protein